MEQVSQNRYFLFCLPLSHSGVISGHICPLKYLFLEVKKKCEVFINIIISNNLNQQCFCRIRFLKLYIAAVCVLLILFYFGIILNVQVYNV